MNFLAEKTVHGLDDIVLFICKENIEWRNSVIEQGHEESIKLLKELKELTNTMQKDMKCIDLQLLKEDKKTLEDSSDIIQVFKDRVQQIQEEKSLTIEYFSKIARIESMLVFCFDHLEMHKGKVVHVSKKKEVWKQQILHIGLPHYQLILNFSSAHLELQNIQSTPTLQDKQVEATSSAGV